MKNNIQLLKETILSSDRILILTHSSPDGDALGSVAALKQIIKKMGKEADCFLEELCPSRFPHLKDCFTVQKSTEEIYDLVILADCADRGRTGVVYPAPKTLCFVDHHISNPKDGQINVVNPDAAATCEMVYDLMNEWEIPCDGDLAAAIYTGILTDTGGFLFQNTTKKTHEIIADLLNFSFDRNSIVRISFQEKSLTYSKLYAHLFETLCHNEEHGAVIGFIDYETYCSLNATVDDTEGLSAALRNISNVECAVLLTEREKGFIKGSVRSNDRYNANDLANQFGGGGHMRAAGFKTNLTYQEIKEKIYEWLSTHQ
ncbi:MAG: bifunctional oligoribonuclease/PAP phosphatase NrnA [Clostridia bacterium]|nr:bifunctional oligoribonuclease/PAP phosphatase NrnA [Clostridia bacterium]